LETLDHIIQAKGGDIINKAKPITREQADAIQRLLEPTERLIFRVAVETGMRISDILQLRATAVGRYIHVVERKTKKFRTVELSDELVEALSKHRGLWYDVKPSQWLFKSRRDVLKPYNRMTYHRALKRAAEALKIDFSAHSMRKLYAQNIFDRTGNLFAVQEAMKHKYVTTTAAYLGVDINALILQAVTPS